MDIVLEVRAEGVVRQFRLLGALARNPRPLLKRWAGYVSSEVRDHFAEQGPGWPPRAPATLARMASAVTQSRASDSQLGRDLRRNLRRVLARELEAGRLASKGGLRQAARLGRIQRLLERASAGEDLTKREARTLATARRKASEKRARQVGPLLGRLRTGAGIEIGRFELRHFARAPWAAVHNSGGTAGHGAKIPARPFEYLTDEDLDVLTFIAAEVMADAGEGD